MKAKPKYVVMFACIILLISAGSFFTGRQIEEQKILQASSKKVTQIALVNQDSGTNYKERNVNYASDLIKSLDSDFVLTNREAGKSGVENGKYAAMIIIPGTFSKNITTINDINPSKVEIYYETNDKLSDENKLLVSAKISDFEKKLNNKLSFMFVSSMFDELHQGQDYASELLKNDSNDLNAINSINDVNILEAINLTQLENQNIDVKDLDINKNFQENKEIIKQIDEKYKEKLIARADSLKDELLTVTGNSTEGIKSFRNKIENITPEQLQLIQAKRHIYNYSSLVKNYDVNVDDVNKYINDLTVNGGTIDNVFNTYNQNVLAVLDIKGKNAFRKSNENLTKVKGTTDTSGELINSSLADLNTLKGNLTSGNVNDSKLQTQNINLINNISNQLNSIQSNLKETSTSTNNVVTDSDYNYINNLFAEDEKPLNEKLKVNGSLIKEIKQCLAGNNQKVLISSIKTNNQKNVEDVTNEVENVVESTVAYDGPIDVKILLKVFDENYVSRFDKLIKEADEFEKTIKTTDNDKEITELWAKYDKSNNNLNDAVTKQSTAYEEHITAMEQGLDNGIKTSQEKLSGALKNAKETKQNSAYSNQKNLSGFSTLLSNSRIGTVENTNMYEFMISPVSTIKTENLLGSPSKSMAIVNYEKEIATAFLIIVLLLVSSKLLISKKKSI